MADRHRRADPRAGLLRPRLTPVQCPVGSVPDADRAADEGPTLERLLREFLPANGFVPTGRHHEIYLSDARKTEPARLMTILRQPVST